jgi:hypothetical protein
LYSQVAAAEEDDSAAKEASAAPAADEPSPAVADGGSSPVAPPDTTGLQALTGAMDRLEAFLRSGEAVTNSDGITGPHLHLTRRPSNDVLGF